MAQQTRRLNILPARPGTSQAIASKISPKAQLIGSSGFYIVPFANLRSGRCDHQNDGIGLYPKTASDFRGAVGVASFMR